MVITSNFWIWNEIFYALIKIYRSSIFSQKIGFLLLIEDNQFFKNLKIKKKSFIYYCKMKAFDVSSFEV